MANTVLQKRTFSATLPPFLAIPPTVDEIGQIVVSAHSAQRGVFIAVSDDAVPTNPIWHQIDGGGVSVNVSVNIPTGTGGSVEDDINEFDFAASPPSLPKDSTATSEALMLAGYNVYFISTRDGATYLYGGAVDVAIGNEATPFDGSVPGAPAPTDHPHATVLTADLIPFGGNPDALVQNPAAASPQSITPGAATDVAMALVPAAGQTANLMEMPGIQFTSVGMLQGLQGAVGSPEIIKLEQFIGAAPMLTAHSRGAPAVDLITMEIVSDPLGDGIDRAVMAGDATDQMIVDNAIVDGGVFV